MGLKQMFKGMDSDNSGTITLEELKHGLAKQGTKLSEYEVQQLMEAVSHPKINNNISYFEEIKQISLVEESLRVSSNVFFYFFLMHIILSGKQADADGNGTIDYDEFITATMHMNRMDREEHLYTAFQYFDKDNSG